ncbi:metalloprotease secretion chaperone CpaB [Lysobacter sp. BMK333-48F3]|uniref:metalloprotease secretion chaperone CpaB n=1 Tax=Lysobacter sp. BMK333-48F3 TaxID=2867962 RepID=UPI001C8B15AB|nr:metalloprotease secretion chaperone CpaB [Lysobacter sp. BMK333-48F3]MBX9404045.1 metalloprotease secretion chaperone CpaB [Lysobacter sp. BMK333-48F3]
MSITRKHALATALALTAAATVGLFLVERTRATAPSAAASLLASEPAAEPAAGAGARTASTPVDAFVARRSATFSLDRTRLQQARARKDVLQLADPARVAAGALKPTPRQMSDGRQFVAYDAYVLEARGVGDEFEVYVPNIGLTLHGVIDTVEVNGDIVRWSGTFEDFNSTQSRFSISQTMIDDYVLGSFDTPMGSYNLEAKNGLGWIVEQGADFHLPADGKDYLQAAPRR